MWSCISKKNTFLCKENSYLPRFRVTNILFLDALCFLSYGLKLRLVADCVDSGQQTRNTAEAPPDIIFGEIPTTTMWKHYMMEAIPWSFRIFCFIFSAYPRECVYIPLLKYIYVIGAADFPWYAVVAVLLSWSKLWVCLICMTEFFVSSSWENRLCPCETHWIFLHGVPVQPSGGNVHL